MEEEADWTPLENEENWLESAAYLERQAMEIAIRNQITPSRMRLRREIESLVSSQAPENGVEKLTAQKQRKVKAKEATKAAVSRICNVQG